MTEAGEYFAWLGLAPGTYSEQQLADRLEQVRRDQPDETRLATASLAYWLLRDPGFQARHRSAALAELSVAEPFDRATLHATEAQVEAAFCAAAGALFEGPTFLLRYSARRRLIDLAGRLGIVPFEANLLIERARFRASRRPAWLAEPEPLSVDSRLPFESPLARPVQSARRLTRWLVAVGLAIAMDVTALFFLLK
jgi:hypothetical protein